VASVSRRRSYNIWNSCLSAWLARREFLRSRRPPHLDQLCKAATLALKSSRTNPPRVPGPEQAGDDALITVMQAMADPKKTAAVYFAMSEAHSRSHPVIARSELCPW
jgi:hypothetical protein